MSDTKTFVLYHGNCADGFGAAYSAWKKLGDTAQYLPVSYGNPPPLDQIPERAMVYLLDFSYPRAVLNSLWMERGCTIQVIDHHKTAQEALADFPGAIFDMDHSGAWLAWHFFHDTRNPTRAPDFVPPLIKFIEDRDMWWWKLPDSREVSAALWSYPMDFTIWSTIDRRLRRAVGLQSFVQEGQAILRYMEQQVVMICRQARMDRMDGHDIPVVNATSLWSEVGEMLLKMFPHAPFAASYADRRDGIRTYSLRSRGDFDVSQVARIRGGGGHRAAAGFEVKMPTLAW